MTTPQKKRKARKAVKPPPDPKLLLAKLKQRLAKEQAGLSDYQRRLLRIIHAYERRHRLVAHLTKRIAKLEQA